jgi:hypothetical protein
MVRPDPNYQPGDVKAVFNPETEVTSNYFGGEQAADGTWHGHVDVNPEGQVTYQRPPGEKR